VPLARFLSQEPVGLPVNRCSAIRHQFYERTGHKVQVLVPLQGG
jgi:hypothetical protein